MAKEKDEEEPRQKSDRIRLKAPKGCASSLCIDGEEVEIKGGFLELDPQRHRERIEDLVKHHGFGLIRP